MMIAFSGKQRSGKDTLAAFFVNEKNFRKISFASDLKDRARKAFDLNFYDESIKEEYRDVLQDFGKICRRVDENFLIKPVLDHVFRKPDNYVLTDLRFQNEAKALRKRSWKLIRLEVPREVRSKRGILSHENNVSETDLDRWDDWDVVVCDDGSLKTSEVAEAIYTALKIGSRATIHNASGKVVVTYQTQKTTPN